MNAWVEPGFMPAPSHMGNPNGMYSQPPQSQPNSRLGPTFVSYLREQFKQDPKPSTAYKRQIAIELGVHIAKINNWFQNERAKAKQVLKDQQRRLAAGESPEDNAEPSPSASSSPPISQSRPHGPSSRPPPLAITTLPSSSTEPRRFEALDLQFQPQTAHYDAHSLDSGMVPVSAPAHMVSFPQQLFADWVDVPQSNAEAFPVEPLPIPATTPSFAPGTAVFYSEVSQPELTWPAPQYASFEEFNLGCNFDAPLMSAQLADSFHGSSQPEVDSQFIMYNDWPNRLPELSPSESNYDHSIYSESTPMTPAVFVPDSYQTSEDFKEDVRASTSPAAACDNLLPLEYSVQIPSRPSSTKPGFTAKRNIEISRLNLNSSALSMGKLRMPQSAGIRPPRSPLQAIRDDSRRVSKHSSHSRPSVPNTPC